MKTKTITKTFYLSSRQINDIKEGLFIGAKKETMLYSTPIQISWQEPERKIEISESQFECAFDETPFELYSAHRKETFYNNLKQKLFGAEK